jgi:hypothetical protein
MTPESVERALAQSRAMFTSKNWWSEGCEYM